MQTRGRTAYDGVMKSPTELTAAFRSRGLKVTPQRQRIFSILHDNPAHPSAEMVFERARIDMPTMSLRTVYQTLNDLASMGEIASLDLGTGATRFDPTTLPHHHLVCTSCGAVHDLHIDFPDVVVPDVASEGFTVNATEIVFRGVCEQCAMAPSTISPSTSKKTTKEALTRHG